MHKLKPHLKQSFWPTLAPMVGLALIDPLQRYLRIPSWLSLGLIVLGCVAYWSVYAASVWRQATAERRELEEKHARADAIVFGPRP